MSQKSYENTNMIISYQVRNIAQIIWNTNDDMTKITYDPNTLNNDFVILKLETPLEFNLAVQPACLPSSAAYLAWYLSSTEERCFTSGWGALSSGKHFVLNCQFITI